MYFMSWGWMPLIINWTYINYSIFHLTSNKQNAKRDGFWNNFILKSIHCQLVPLFKWLDVHSSNIYSIVTTPQYTLTTHPRDSLCCLFAQHYSHKNKLHEIHEERKKEKKKNQIPNSYDCCSLVTISCQSWKIKVISINIVIGVCVL